MAKSTRKPGTAAGTPRVLNVVPSSDTGKDWPLSVGLAAGSLRTAKLPPSVDLRAAWWNVGDQGATGSCVGWATADGVMRYLLVGAAKLKRTEHLSPRYIWMASKETDGFTSRPQTFIEEAGTSLKTAADICRKYGVALDRDLPFAVQNVMYAGNEDEFYARAAQRKAASYFNARKNPAQWKAALAAGQPILAGLMVDAAWMSASGNAQLDNHNAATVSGGHAICIVGYRADGRFIVRNSWGTGWGDKGFAYVSPAYIAAGFFDESYVMTL